MSDLYQKIQDKPEGFLSKDKDYCVFPDASGHVIKSIHTQKQTGWKFYLSIIPADLGSALEIVTDIMATQKEFALKVLDNGIKENPELSTKAIVLYDTGNQDWNEVVPQIELALFQAHITPDIGIHNKDHPTEKNVDSSAYFTYASELNAFGKPKPSSVRETYNDFGLADPFENLSALPKFVTPLKRHLEEHTEEPSSKTPTVPLSPYQGKEY